MCSYFLNTAHTADCTTDLNAAIAPHHQEKKLQYARTPYCSCKILGGNWRRPRRYQLRCREARTARARDELTSQHLVFLQLRTGDRKRRQNAECRHQQRRTAAGSSMQHQRHTPSFRSCNFAVHKACKAPKLTKAAATPAAHRRNECRVGILFPSEKGRVLGSVLTETFVLLCGSVAVVCSIDGRRGVPSINVFAIPLHA